MIISEILYNLLSVADSDWFILKISRDVFR